MGMRTGSAGRHMTDWLSAIADLLNSGPVAAVTVLSAEGSTPRETGARMLVNGCSTFGTIGGGALEFAAIAQARAALVSTAPRSRRIVDMPLGPALQQCCGGFVQVAIETMTGADKAVVEEMLQARRGLLVRPATSNAPWQWLTERRESSALPLPVAHAVRAMLSGSRAPGFAAIESGEEIWLVEPIRPPRPKLYLYGAGHVGRDVVSVLDGLAYDVVWVDVARERFPPRVPDGVDMIVADDPVAVARAAPAGALHVVMTFSHALDEAITAVLLGANTFAYLGLIGSKTKRARFVQRFRRAGISETAINRLTCPIGLSSVPGKEPRAIAIALAAELLQLPAALGTARAPQAVPGRDAAL